MNRVFNKQHSAFILRLWSWLFGQQNAESGMLCVCVCVCVCVRHSTFVRMATMKSSISVVLTPAINVSNHELADQCRHSSCFCWELAWKSLSAPNRPMSCQPLRSVLSNYTAVVVHPYKGSQRHAESDVAVAGCAAMTAVVAVHRSNCCCCCCREAKSRHHMYWYRCCCCAGAAVVAVAPSGVGCRGTGAHPSPAHHLGHSGSTGRGTWGASFFRSFPFSYPSRPWRSHTHGTTSHCTPCPCCGFVVSFLSLSQSINQEDGQRFVFFPFSCVCVRA